MGSKAYRFTRFTLLKAPGFSVRSFGEFNDLHPGLTIFTGANGVGKTTIIRAMWSLLFTPEKHPGLEAEGVVKSAESLWHLLLSGQHLQQKRLSDGLVASLPGRNDAFGDAYWFPLHELIQNGGSSAPFLEEIRKEMQGGIDLEQALRDAGGLESFSARRHTPASDFKKKLGLAEQKKNAIIGNLDLRERIDQLREEIKKSNALQTEKEHIETLLSYLSAKEEYEKRMVHLSSYDAVLANMTPHTLEDALSWEDEYTQAEENLRQIEKEQEETQRNLDACKISDEVRMDLNLPGLINQRIEALKTAEQELNVALKDAGQAKAARKTWEDAHQWIVTEKPDETTLKSMVSTLRDLSYRSEPLRCMLASRAQIVQSLGQGEAFDEVVLEQLREVKQRLALLLSLVSRRETLDETIQMKSSTGLSLSLLIGLFFSLLGYLVHPGLGLLVIPSLLLLLLFARKERINPVIAKQDEAIQKAWDHVKPLLEKAGQPSLDALDSESIANTIGSLARSIATMERTERENAKRDAAQDAYDKAYQAYADWLDAWNTAASDLHLGDDPALEGAQFFHFAEHLQQWVLSCAREAEAEATLDDAKLSYAKAFEALQKICEATTEDLVELKNEAAILVSSITDARRYYEQLIKERDACKRAEKQFKDICESRQAFYTRLHLSLGDIHTLKRLAPQVAEYTALATQVQIDKASLERYSAIVIQEASSHERSPLQIKLEAIKANLENLDIEKKKLWDMEKTYEDLCSDTELEEAELNLEKAAELLDALRHEEVSKRMVHLLYEQVKEQSERIYQPQVLSRASQWFKRITKNRYTLSVGDVGFLAQDTVMMRSYSLDELSSGSRIQLLFSLRMAFIELLESNEHYRFPLFFDELMANSDDERSLAIAEAIAEISRERQVFYCTAQADEVGKLQQVVGEQVSIVNLIDRKRNYQESIHPFEPVAVEREELPQFCEDYNVYAQHCKVAKPLLWEPLGILSPWYLCTSSSELAALLKRGFSTCGQAKEVSDLYQKRLSLLGSAQKLARKGRPRVVTKADLEDDELKVNRNAGYYASLLTFLEDGDKTGNDILEAIQNKELKAIRETTREVLSSFLVSRGFASDEYPLFPDEILSRISLQDETLLTDSDEYLIVKRYLASVLEGV